MQKVVIPPVVALNEMLTGWLNGLNGTNAILLGLILGGMMAIDMGGPINKAAFTFGIAAIEAQNFGVHSAVMAGGMVPPLTITRTGSAAANGIAPSVMNDAPII